MKIAVLGGTGMVGSRIVAEGARRGHEVTAVSRGGGDSDTDNVTAVAMDVADSSGLAQLATDHEVVVSALGPSREPGGDPGAFAGTLVAVAKAVTPTRLIVVGGAGSLLVAPGVRLIDSPEFPEEARAESLAGIAAFEALQSTNAGPWTYLSPPPVLQPGERTGTYAIGDDAPVGDSISAEDYAIALVDEIEQSAHPDRRFTVATAR